MVHSPLPVVPALEHVTPSSGLPYSVSRGGTDQFLTSLMEVGCGYSDTWGSQTASLLDVKAVPGTYQEKLTGGGRVLAHGLRRHSLHSGKDEWRKPEAACSRLSSPGIRMGCWCSAPAFSLPLAFFGPSAQPAVCHSLTKPLADIPLPEGV